MKNILNNKYSGIALTALFGIVAFLFWRVFYPHALVYQEQYQLFLFDSSYIIERISLDVDRRQTAATYSPYLHCSLPVWDRQRTRPILLLRYY